MADGMCSVCGVRPKQPTHYYCKLCRAAYMRRWRKDNEPAYADWTPEEKQRSRCRAYTGTLVKRGKLVRGPCENCGTDEDIEAHHKDYTKPREVIWMCRMCHRTLHGKH